jgi:hypothetical protein
MTFILNTDTDPWVEAKTHGVWGIHNVLSLSADPNLHLPILEIGVEDFCMLVQYFLENTDFYEDDPRPDLLEYLQAGGDGRSDKKTVIKKEDYRPEHVHVKVSWSEILFTDFCELVKDVFGYSSIPEDGHLAKFIKKAQEAEVTEGWAGKKSRRISFLPGVMDEVRELKEIEDDPDRPDRWDNV